MRETGTGEIAMAVMFAVSHKNCLLEKVYILGCKRKAHVMKNLSLVIHPHVISDQYNFLQKTQIDILKNQTLIFFLKKICFPKKKKSHTGFGQHE